MMNNEILEHYGVKGMQWGVRRSRAQLRRASQQRKSRRDPSTPEGAEISRRKKAAQNRRTLDKSELDSLVKRLEAEKKLKSLVSDDLASGSAAAKKILGETGTQVLKQVAAGVAIAGISVAIGNKMGSGDRATNTPQEVANLIKTGGKKKSK